jgi:hypothetical protein
MSSHFEVSSSPSRGHGGRARGATILGAYPVGSLISAVSAIAAIVGAVLLSLSLFLVLVSRYGAGALHQFNIDQ